MSFRLSDYPIIAYLIWKGSYNRSYRNNTGRYIIAYLIWKGSYNGLMHRILECNIIAYLIWKGSYNSIKRSAHNA